MTADVVRGDNWFESTEAVQKLDEEGRRDQTWVSSPRKNRKKQLLALAKMLAVPAIVAASVGIAIGVYITYNKPPQAAAPQTAQAQPAATMPTPAAPAAQQPAVVTTSPPAIGNAESNNAATASAGGDQPEPPTKAEAAAPAHAAAELAKEHAGEAGAEPTLTQDAPASAQAAIQPATANVQPAVQPPSTTPSAPAAPAEPAPIAAKVESPETPPTEVHEIQTKSGVVKLVDVRIDSKPSGATVMLVDNGKTSFLGTTPLATSLDPAHGYDVIFTLEGRPTQMAHLEPGKSARLDVSLGHAHHTTTSSTSPSTPAIARVEPVAKSAPVTKTESPAKAIAKTESIAKPEAKVEAPVKAQPAKAKAGAANLADPFGAPSAKGTLMVSSKPPCEIYIDGQATGLTTPQRSIAVGAGHHKVTFVNAAQNIKKTVTVSITADKSTKLIQDLMAK